MDDAAELKPRIDAALASIEQFSFQITPISNSLAGVNNGKELIRVRSLLRAVSRQLRGEDPYPEITAMKARRSTALDELGKLDGELLEKGGE